MNIKDILQIVVVPLTLAVLALLWPAIQARARRRAFGSLILRELEEIGPYPDKPDRAGWWEHQSKEFVHQKIFTEPSANRDFILSLEPGLVYFVSQLWDAKKAHDQDQWLHYLEELSDSRYDRSGKIAKALEKWRTMCDAYKTKAEV